MTGKLAEALTREQIESHSSALTNDRINQIELAIDIVRRKAGRDPVIENLAEYAATLGAWHSYLQTLKTIDLSEVQKLFKEIQDLHDYLRYNVKTPAVQSFINQYPKTYPTEIQRVLLAKCNKCADMLRVCFQTLNYYFRTGNARQNFGVEGDLARAINEMQKPVKRTKKNELENVE